MARRDIVKGESTHVTTRFTLWVEAVVAESEVYAGGHCDIGTWNRTDGFDVHCRICRAASSTPFPTCRSARVDRAGEQSRQPRRLGFSARRPRLAVSEQLFSGALLLGVVRP